jgi:hypothetical protein
MRFLTAVHEILAGRYCTAVSFGGIGTAIKLYLANERIPDPLPVEEARANAGSTLMVWCAWRLDGKHRPLASWDDPVEVSKPVVARLRGERIASVEVFGVAFDLNLRWSSGAVLRVFCDHVDTGGSWESNWNVADFERRCTVGLGGAVDIVPRDSAPEPPGASIG